MSYIPTKPVRIWLYTISACIVLLILFGGFVRLSRAGLSMVDWHVITGIVPPMGDAAWQEAFNQYQKTPEFKFVKRYPNGPYDLFDLQEDPQETINRAGWAKYQDRQDDLETRLEAWYAAHEDPNKCGLRVKALRQHNSNEAWRDGKRERRGLQVY